VMIRPGTTLRKETIVLRRERGDQLLIEPPPLGDVDPFEELIRVVNKAQEREARDEHLYEPKLGVRS